MKHYRNPTSGEVFAYDSEAEREEWGALELVAMSDEEVVQHLAPQASQVKAVEAALQIELDRRAQQSGYDNILSACSYAAQPQGAPFQAEGAAFLAWRSAVWAEAYAVLAEVQAGRQQMPTPAEAVSSMPALNLP